MQSISQFKDEYTFAPSPVTARGFSSCLSTANNKIAFCSGNNIIVRSGDDLKNCQVFTEHKFDTTCVRLNHNGTKACSGDSKGNVIVWEVNDNLSVRKSFTPLIQGIVKDIAWTDDDQRIIAVGGGSQSFGKAVMVETGSQCGEITGYTKMLNTVDIKPQKPYKALVGGEEFNIGFFTGPPFKWTNSIKSHKNFVNCIRYSHDGELVASISSDKAITLYNGLDGEQTKQLENAHDMGILQLSWFADKKQFATASSDQTIKIWDESLQKLKTLRVSEEKNLNNMQVSVGTVSNNVVSISLNGNINIWRDIQLDENVQFPNEVIVGHSVKVNQTLQTKNGTIISGDQSGRVLIWNNRSASQLSGNESSQAVVKFSISKDHDLLYCLHYDNELRIISVENKTVIAVLKIENGKSIDLVASKSSNSVFYVLHENQKYSKFENQKLVEEPLSLKFVPSCFDINQDDSQLCFGDDKGNVHILNSTSNDEIQLFNHYQQKISAVKFSNNGKMIAVGDVSKIKLFDVENKKLLTERWTNHTSQITQFDFSKSDTYLLSVSQDNRAIVWNCQTQNKVQQFDDVHKKGITGGCFDNEGRILTSGADNLIKNFGSKTDLYL